MLTSHPDLLLYLPRYPSNYTMPLKNLYGIEKQSLYYDGYLLHNAFIATAKSFQSGPTLKLMKDYFDYENNGGKRLSTADLRVMINHGKDSQLYDPDPPPL